MRVLGVRIRDSGREKKKGTYRLLESPVLKHPPNARVHAQVLPKVEEGAQRHARGLERAADVARHAAGGILVGLDDHDAVPEIAAEEEVLAEEAGVRGEVLDGGVVEGGEEGREGFEELVVLGHEVGFGGGRVDDGAAEGAGRAHGALDEVRHVPHGADVLAVLELVGGEVVGHLGDVADAHGVDGGAVGGGSVGGGEVVAELVGEGFHAYVGESSGGW